MISPVPGSSTTTEPAVPSLGKFPPRAGRSRAASSSRLERLLGHGLDVEVDGEHDVVSGNGWRGTLLDDPDRVAIGVDLDMGDTGHATQIVLVHPLDSRLPDVVALDVRLVGVGTLFEFDVVDLAHVTEHVRGHRAVGVDPDRCTLDDDAREVLLVLLDVDLELFGHVLGHRHRGVGAEPLIVDALAEIGGGDRVAGTGQVVGQAHEQRVGLVVLEFGEGGPVDGHDHRDPVVDDHLVVAVEDAAPGSLLLHDADAVRLGCLLELRRRRRPGGTTSGRTGRRTTTR